MLRESTRWVSKRKIRPIGDFRLFMNNNFLLWILFPDKNEFVSFKQFLKQSNIVSICKRLSNLRKKSKKLTSQFLIKFEMLSSSSICVVSFQNEKDLDRALLFFLKDKVFDFKNFFKEKKSSDLSDYIVPRSGFIVAIKLYKYIFSFNTYFLNLYRNLRYSLYLNTDVFNMVFLKIIINIVCQLLLICIIFFKILWTIFFRMTSQFVFILKYANKKSIST